MTNEAMKRARKASEAQDLGPKLAEALAMAIEAEAGLALIEDREVFWAEVATYAGNIQRRARLLAGLGRGG